MTEQDEVAASARGSQALRLAQTIRGSEWFRMQKRKLRLLEYPSLAQVVALVEKVAATPPPPDHPRTYSLVGTPHLFLVTDDESGMRLGYADKIGGPLVRPSAAPALDVEAIAEVICDNNHWFHGHTGKDWRLCPMWDQHKAIAIQIADRLTGQQEREGRGADEDLTAERWMDIDQLQQDGAQE